MSRVLCLVSRVSCLVSRVSRLTSHISRLVSRISRLVSHVPFLSLSQSFLSCSPSLSSYAIFFFNPCYLFLLKCRSLFPVPNKEEKAAICALFLSPPLSPHFFPFIEHNVKKTQVMRWEEVFHERWDERWPKVLQMFHFIFWGLLQANKNIYNNTHLLWSSV
jgi:hypothetical protein